MRSLYQILTTVLILVIFQGSLIAQSLAGMKVYDTPGKFNNPRMGVSLKVGNPDKVDNFLTTTWIVFSDRDNNHSFIEPDGKKIKKKISFLEKFYVVDEKGDYLHVVKDPMIEGKRLSSNSMDYGWIKKDNLLLWNKAIKNERNIDRKALIINKIEAIEMLSDQELEESKVVFRSSPYSDNQTENESSVFEIFYVYKIEGERILLGNAGMVSNPSNIKRVLQGWVPKTRLTLWESRLAIEPNWIPAASEERINNNIKASIFIDESSAKSFSRNPQSANAQKVLWNNDRYKERQNGYWFRFPILEKMSGSGMFHAGTMGNLTSDMQGAFKEETNDRISEDREKVMKKLEQKETINIGFVIDGTTSMQPYFDAVSEALKEAMIEISNSYNTFKMKFGVVVYRDKPEGSRQFQISKLTSDHAQTVRFLKDVKAIDQNDTDAPESVYDGLTYAMQYLFQNDDQTNLLIHIGDAGNNKITTQATSEDVIGLMAQKRINYSVFQVANKGQNTYNEFSSESESLIWNTANKIYLSTKNKLGMNSQQAQNMQEPELITKEDNSTFEIKQINNYPGGILTNLVFCKPPGLPTSEPTVLSSDVVKSRVQDIVSSSVEILKEFQKETEDVVLRGKSLKNEPKVQPQRVKPKADLKYTNSFNSAIITLMSDANISPEKIDFLCGANFQMYQPGYAPEKADGLSHPLFKSVILMSRNELFNLIRIFDKLINAYNATDQRKSMRNTWLELLKTNLGENEQNYLDMDLNAINNKVTGIEKSNETLMRVKLKDITSPEVFSDKEFNKYVANITSKRFNLDKIGQNDEYQFMFTSNYLKYYWIPIDYLP